MTAPVVTQAKAALNKNLAVTQSNLAKRTQERDDALAQIQAAVDRAEIAERSARDMARELERSRANHKDVVETKRRTDARLRAGLDGLQAIYTLCAARPENADPEAMLKAIYQIAGDSFDKATHEMPRSALILE